MLNDYQLLRLAADKETAIAQRAARRQREVLRRDHRGQQRPPAEREQQDDRRHAREVSAVRAVEAGARHGLRRHLDFRWPR